MTDERRRRDDGYWERRNEGREDTPGRDAIALRGSLSYRSAWSVLSAVSFLSVASAASLLSIGSFASILSIGSSCSVLSIGSDGGFLSIGRSRPRRQPLSDDPMERIPRMA